MNANRRALSLLASVLVSLFVGVAGLAPAGAQTSAAEPASLAPLTASIQSPPGDARVARRFAVDGVVNGTYRNLWLVVRVGDLYWPKEPKLSPVKGRWTGWVNEGGRPPGGRFEVLLIDVPDAPSAAFEAWLGEGRRTGRYPGIRQAEVREAAILDRRSYQLAGS
ncbi:hypothetical protein [Accumulibacter sp.]|uniref:hypothetical protein n=1 Tax=Accumulibacter sp. TaxID=2053492 RepID=UPI0025F48461|nr:hypothetical protein [Accumulibacter sp.]MCM8595558.1 hypothetical protein [Accumulibacter sp.]MCM8625071.1 hypothetical protein [Accumulibacter sp.]MDS4049706.1 hypothetical protein [Accumulibacter sp.]